MRYSVYVKPSARSNNVEVLDESTLRVSVVAPAKEGRANEAVIESLSDHFGVSKSQVRILRGLQTSIKLVEI